MVVKNRPVCFWSYSWQRPRVVSCREETAKGVFSGEETLKGVSCGQETPQGVNFAFGCKVYARTPGWVLQEFRGRRSVQADGAGRPEVSRTPEVRCSHAREHWAQLLEGRLVSRHEVADANLDLRENGGGGECGLTGRVEGKSVGIVRTLTLSLR